MLPLAAALIITLLCIPLLPVNAALPTNPSNGAAVVTIPEDNLKLNTGVMVLGLIPVETDLSDSATNGYWYTDSACSKAVTTADVVGPALTDEPLGYADDNPAPMGPYYVTTSKALCVGPYYFAPPWPKDLAPGWDLLSQHKILATLNGVPTTPTYTLCEIVEKEKAKIPPQTSKTPSLRQFPDEIIGTTLKDVTSNFICKFHWIKPGVGALDVYFVGPHVSNFIADHMLIVTIGYKPAGSRTTIWASELQDICILGWSMAAETMAITLFTGVTLSAYGGDDVYWSWDDALGPFVSCDEAAAWQLAWLTGGWPYAPVTVWPY